jgi:predicted  nucleic acid-binding Zn-ribbon protein
MDNRELEMLRQRIAFLEQTLERCMDHIAALESRVASLELRPVAVAPTEEMVTALAQRVVEKMDPASWKRSAILAAEKETVELLKKQATGDWEPGGSKRQRKT